MQAANLVLRSLLEIGALVALGYGGAHAAEPPTLRVLLAILLPGLAAVVWGLFAAPRALYRAAGLVRVAIELVVFGAAAAALVATGHPRIAVAFAVVATLNAILLKPTG